MSDDFSAGGQNWTIPQSDPPELTPLVDDGADEVRVPVAPAVVSVGHVHSVRRYKLPGSSVSMRFSVANAGGTDSFVVLLLASPEGTARASVTFADGAVNGALYDAQGGVEAGGQIPFEPSVHGYLRIREESGVLYFGTSHDGAGYDEFGQVVVPGDGSLDFVGVQLVAGSDGAAGTSGYIVLDDVNLPAPEDAANWCAASNVQDDFEGASVDGMWEQFTNDSCQSLQSAGELWIEPPSAVSECGYRTWTGYRLTAAGVRVKARLALADDDSYAGLRLHKDALHQVAMRVQAGKLLLRMKDGDPEAFADYPLEYSPDHHAYWKIHADGQEVIWSTSSNGVEWTEQRRLAARFDLDALQIDLYGGNSSDAIDTVPVIAFDDLNLDPSPSR